MVEAVAIRSARGPYEVRIGRGVLGGAGALLLRFVSPGPVLVVTDSVVAPHWLGPVVDCLSAAGFAPEAEILPPGEGTKTMDGLGVLYGRLLSIPADRGSAVVALGGGVVSDLAGFAAATWLRGIPWIALPTTVLAQVDASVGGKTGVNLPEGKNLIGAFHAPSAVLSDVDTLSTLAPRQFRSGLAEVLKTALALDRGLFERIEREPARYLPGGDRDALAAAVASCVRAKGEVVSEDEGERGLRRVLNLGHTAGHALEAAAGYGPVLHGEAVAVGLVVAARIAEQRGVAPPGLARRIAALLASLGLPARVADLGVSFAPEVLRPFLARDKKKRGTRLPLVLPAEPGRTVIVEDGTADEVLAALA